MTFHLLCGTLVSSSGWGTTAARRPMAEIGTMLIIKALEQQVSVVHKRIFTFPASGSEFLSDKLMRQKVNIKINED